MKYTGLCIGGPYDGQRHVSERRAFRVEERPAATRRLGTEPISDRVTIKTHTYVHHELVPGSGIFVPESSMPLDAVVNGILLVYENAVNR